MLSTETYDRKTLVLGQAAVELVTSGACGHLVTIDPDARPHVTLAWFDVDGDDLVFATLTDQRKLHNLRRDPRAVVSFQSDEVNERGALLYLVVEGVATVAEGGAPALLQRLAYRSLGPDVTFPAMADPPEGYITRIAVESVGGIGPWTQ